MQRTLGAAVLVLLLLASRPGRAAVTVRVSTGAAGEANRASFDPALSADGRFVAFSSGADNLVPGDSNGVVDVFVADRDSDSNGVLDEPGGIAIRRVSVTPDGQEADAACERPSISGNGRYVAFETQSPRLTGLALGTQHIVVVDRDTDGDGVFDEPAATAIGLADVSTTGIPADRDSFAPSLSHDGRFIAFSSLALNLAPVGSAPPSHVYRRDPLSGSTLLVSVAPDGSPGNDQSYQPSIAADGRLVAFASDATNFVLDDGNQFGDVFLRDVVSGFTSLISRAMDGGPADASSYDPALSADGAVVAFTSSASNLVADDANGLSDVFVRDRSAGVTERVSRDVPIPPPEVTNYADSFEPTISGDGRLVAFVFGDFEVVQNDIYLYDRTNGGLTRITTSGGDVPSGDNQNSGAPALSADGRFVAFDSYAPDIVPGDGNDAQDVFVHGSRCGDGVVDVGETCEGGACCTALCGFASAGTVCRPAAGTCDAAEGCSGASSVCPADAPRADGSACDDGDPCTTGDVCTAGACGARVCGADVAAVDRGDKPPVIDVTCDASGTAGEPAKGSCRAVGFESSGEALPGAAVVPAAMTAELNGPRRVTRGARERIGRSGRKVLRLHLNSLGRRRLRQQADRGEPLTVVVRVRIRSGGVSAELLRRILLSR